MPTIKLQDTKKALHLQSKVLTKQEQQSINKRQSTRQGKSGKIRNILEASDPLKNPFKQIEL